MHLNPYLGYDSAYTYPINALLLISYTAVDSVTFRYARSPAAHKNQKITNTSVCPFGDGSSLIGWNTYYTILFAIGPRIPSPHPTVACLFLMTTGSKFSVFKHVSVDFPFFFFRFFLVGHFISRNPIGFRVSYSHCKRLHRSALSPYFHCSRDCVVYDLFCLSLPVPRGPGHDAVDLEEKT